MFYIKLKLTSSAAGPFLLADGGEWRVWYDGSKPEPTEACWSVHAWDNDERVWVRALDEANARAIYAAVAQFYFEGYGVEEGSTLVEGTAALCYGVPATALDDASIVASKYIACTVCTDGTGTITRA